MIRYIYLLAALITTIGLSAQDTVVVKTFTYDSVSRDAVFEFPDEGPASWHKILMEYGMRCHDLAVGNGDVGCREWDYSCNTMIYDSSRMDSVLTDVNGQLEYVTSPARYEIMSFVTPYGNGLDLGPDGKVWTFDVTDFAPILNGKKRIALVAGGQNQEEMSITFKFIRGTPVREVLDIRQIWPVQFGVNPDPIAANRLFEPRTVTFPAGTDAVKLRSIVTGHGQTGEFTPFKHKLSVNGGAQEYEYTVWLDCSEVPVYPQGGTWLFDRAGWCPGDPSQVNEFYLEESVVSDGQAELDYSIKDAANDGQTRYIVNNQVVYYGPVNFDNDAELLNVMQPTKRVEQARYNPICTKPRIVIRNNGNNVLNDLTINYGVVGMEMNTVNWTGGLSFGETDTLDLDYPESVFMGLNGDHQFVASIENADEYASNNTYTAKFDPVEMYKGERVLVLLTTNLAPKDNTLTITNSDDEIVLEYDDLVANRSYFDEVVLPSGCYRLLLTDRSDDGLYYWFYERNGNGLGRGGLEIFVDDDPVKEFEPEFGGFVRFDFVVEGETSTDEREIGRLRVYPNPATDDVQIEIENIEEMINFKLISLMGQVLREKTIDSNGNKINTKLNVSDLKPGQYILELSQGNISRSTKLVIK